MLLALLFSIISGNAAKRQEIQLCGVSKELAVLQGDFERIGMEVKESQISSVEGVREDILEVRLGVENLTEFTMASLAVLLSALSTSENTASSSTTANTDISMDKRIVRRAASVQP